MATLVESQYPTESSRISYLAIFVKIWVIQARLVVWAAAENKMANPATPENFETPGLAGRTWWVADTVGGFGYLIGTNRKSKTINSKVS